MRDPEEFEAFAHSVAPMLHRLAWLLTADRHWAEDLVQETLAKMYVASSQRRPIENPAGYARTVLVRLHVDERRRRRSSEIVTDRIPDILVNSDHTATLALRSALAGLDPTDRTILVLRYYADLSVNETARDLDISAGAVRTRTSRALARLSGRLGPGFVHEEPHPTPRQP